MTLPLLVQYRFSPDDDPQVDYALNLSRGGVFIAAPDLVQAPGTVVYVTLTARDGTHIIEGTGHVVRVQGEGLAIELDGLASDDQTVLDGWVKAALEAASVRRPDDDSAG